MMRSRCTTARTQQHEELERSNDKNDRKPTIAAAAVAAQSSHVHAPKDNKQEKGETDVKSTFRTARHDTTVAQSRR